MVAYISGWQTIYKGPSGNCFCLCVIWCLWQLLNIAFVVGVQPIHRPYINEFMWLCFNKALFTKTRSGLGLDCVSNTWNRT